MNSITKFCEDPTITNWNKISQINKNTMIGIAVHCLNNNIGNKNIAKKIVSYKKSHIQKPMDLSLVYTTTQSRVNLSNLIKQHLSSIVKVFGEVCVNGKNTKLLEKIELKKLLGLGVWGNVYSACLPKPCNDNSYNFAIKLAKMRKPSFKWNSIVKFQQPFHEYFLLNDLIKPLVVNGICPNLPLLIDTFSCRDCEFTFHKSTSISYPDETLIKSRDNCLIFLTELSTLGDMKNWIQKYNRNPNEEQLYSALFQIMVAVHTIQTKVQLVNGDMKSENTLVYSVKPGGYWEYVVYGTKYYVPNYGQLFILNDFGTSSTYSPDNDLTILKKVKDSSLGDRFKIIINGKYSVASAKNGVKRDLLISYDKNQKNGYNIIESFYTNRQTIDLKTQQINDGNIQLTQQQKDYLTQKNITTDTKSKNFYNHPDIIPPTYFNSDTQDCIRMFLGESCVAQPGAHTKINITKKLRDQLSNYTNVVKAPHMAMFTRPQDEIAGYFIQEFFSIHKDYTKKPKNGKIIQTFNIS